MSHFDALLEKYPALATQDGLIALISEFGSPQNCICYPELKDLRFRLALVGCSDNEIEAIAAFIEDPVWEPQTIDGQRYQTFGHFLISQKLTKYELSSRIENLVHGFQRDRNISGLKPEYMRVHGYDIEFLVPTNLALLDSDKQALKSQVADVCKSLLAVSKGYNLTKQVYDDNGYEDLEPCDASTILDAAQLACKAWISTQSWQWEGGLGTQCWKKEPDHIELWLDFGFDEESPCVTFKAVNPTAN